MTDSGSSRARREVKYIFGLLFSDTSQPPLRQRKTGGSSDTAKDFVPVDWRAPIVGPERAPCVRNKRPRPGRS